MTPNGPGGERYDPTSLGDLLQEMRVLLQGAQMLTSFLVIVPFSEGFSRVQSTERWLYLATFCCAMTSLVLFSAPAVHHRLRWPVSDRLAFKRFATRVTVVGLIPFSAALVLATDLVVHRALGPALAWKVAAVLSLFIAVVWGVLAWSHSAEPQDAPPPNA